MDISERDHFAPSDQIAYPLPLRAFQKAIEPRLYRHLHCPQERLPVTGCGSLAEGIASFATTSFSRVLTGRRGKVTAFAGGKWRERITIAAMRFHQAPDLLVSAGASFFNRINNEGDTITLVGLGGSTRGNEFLIREISVGERQFEPNRERVEGALSALDAATVFVSASTRGSPATDYLPAVVRAIAPVFGDQAHRELMSVSSQRLTLPMRPLHRSEEKIYG